MQCLRCGWCCCNLAVVIVDDPAKGIPEGISEDNLIVHEGKGVPCKHLKQLPDGTHECKIHNEPWYEETPCARHTQIERKDSPCRMGVYVLSGGTK